MTVKYALYPRPVTSKVDGDRHFIGAQDLANLYRVRLDECVIVPWETRPGYERQHELLLERVKANRLIPLYPSYSGDYSLPKPKDTDEHPG